MDSRIKDIVDEASASVGAPDRLRQLGQQLRTIGTNESIAIAYLLEAVADLGYGCFDE